MQSNYEIVRAQWRENFMKMDHAQLAARFGMRLEADRLCLTYFGKPCAVSRRDGRVMCLDKPDAEVGFNQEINILTMFHYAAEHPVPSGNLVPFRQVKRVYPFEAAYRRSILEPLARTFSGKTEALKRAFSSMGAKPTPQGDAGGELEIIPNLRLAVLFWDGDDEFEAQCNMLFDANITDFFHEENVVCAASDAALFLTEAAGVDVDGRLM